MTTHPLVRLALLSTVLVAAACSDLFGPDDRAVPESQLTFVRVSPTAPALAETEVSFWIRRGEAREVQIRYVYPQADGTVAYGKCLRFRVPAEAPLRQADGRVFAAGDSARVTIRVVDAGLFRFEFDPAGLRFDPDHPAELEVRYSYADPDHNGDGVVDERDEEIQLSFGFWHQKGSGQGWRAIQTTRLEDVLEARARITGFSQYALASN